MISSLRTKSVESQDRLRDILRKKLIILHRAEWHRRRGRERARKRAAFIAKTTARDKHSGQLKCSIEEVSHFLQDIMSDPQREQDLGPNEALVNPP